MPSSRFRVGVLTTDRLTSGMGGFGLAEISFIRELKGHVPQLDVSVEVIGGPRARKYADAIGGHWLPGRRGRASFPTRRVDVRHVTGLNIRPPLRTPFVITIQDLAPLRFPDEGRLPKDAADVARAAARVVVPSEFTGREVVDLLEVPRENVMVVPLGLGNVARGHVEPLATDELARLGIRCPYVVRIGGYTLRKNVLRLLKSWPEVHHATGAQLVLGGPAGPDKPTALELASDQTGVVVLDYLPAQLIPRMLAGASAVAWPSIYEGFGLPPLEAMAVGTPVVAVRAGATEEVCGDAALIVDDDSSALSGALIRLLQDESLRERLIWAGAQRVRQFSWKRTADTLVLTYLAVIRGARTSDGRESTAGPLP